MGRQKRIDRIKLGRGEKATLAGVFLLILAIAASFLWTASTGSKRSQSTKPETEDAQRIPAFFETEPPKAQLPATLSPEQVEGRAAARAYQVAKEIPGVLAQQPCFCHCDRVEGHRGLVDCFRDKHAAGCLVCMKEALLADKLHRQGLSAADIRARIIAGDWEKIDVTEGLK